MQIQEFSAPRVREPTTGLWKKHFLCLNFRKKKRLEENAGQEFEEKRVFPQK